MKQENLIENASKMGDYLMSNLQQIQGIKELRGRGLMIGIEFEQPVDEIRDTLLLNTTYSVAMQENTLYVYYQA
jgi:acetylornithine aminotransferase